MSLPPDCTRCPKTRNIVFEKRWPKRVAHLAARSKFRRSLGTPDVEHAWDRRAKVKRDYDAEVLRLERQAGSLVAGNLEQDRSPVTPQTVLSAVEHWRETERRLRFERVMHRFASGEDQDAFEKEVALAGACGTEPSAHAEGYDEWSDANYDAVEALAEAIRRRAGFELSARDDAYWFMGKMVSDAWRAVLEDEKRWRRMDIANPPAGEPPPFKPSRRLSEVYEKFLREKQYARTIEREHRTTFNRFKQFLGSDPGMRDINRQHIADFKQLCFAIPVRMTRDQAKLPLQKLIETLEGEPNERLDIETIRKHIGFLQTFFGWAVRQGEIDSNIAEGIKPAIPRARTRMRTKNRAPMDEAEVRLLFESPIFTGTKSPHRVFDPGNHEIWDERFWIPILAAFTGASTSELAWLQHKDVRETEGIWWLDITSISDHEDDEEERSVKAGARHRKMPLHHRVIEIGFLEYVRSIPDKKGRIFHRLKPDSEGRISKTFSQSMSRYIRRIGITEKRKVFYSLRHTFKDALRNRAKVPGYIQDALMGHAEKGSGKEYGEGPELSVLADAIKRVTIPGFPENMRRYKTAKF